MISHNAIVLVVDDQDSGRFVKAQLLRRAGYTVYEAGTGRETLDMARSASIDLVVLDVNLPDINGFEVGRKLREQLPGPPAIQILHVSSTAVGEADRAEGLNSGADAYLTEPIDPGVLVATANALMRVRRAEQSLADALSREQKAREEAEQANRIKDDFIATLSHELRTPLNALMGWIFQLRQSSLSESARARALDSLERNTRVQAQLINDLLDVSRVAKGKLQLQLRVVNIATVVRDAIESVSAAAREKGVALDVSAQPLHVAGDEARLQQIVGNLLNNAIQFTPDGGRVDVDARRNGGSLKVSVKDTGVGIAPKDQAALAAARRDHATALLAAYDATDAVKGAPRSAWVKWNAFLLALIIVAVGGMMLWFTRQARQGGQEECQRLLSILSIPLTVIALPSGSPVNLTGTAACSSSPAKS